MSAPAVQHIPNGENVDSSAETSVYANGKIGYEEIAKLADSYWEARGCQGGLPEEDWFRAERELRKKITPWISPAEKTGD